MRVSPQLSDRQRQGRALRVRRIVPVFVLGLIAALPVSASQDRGGAARPEAPPTTTAPSALRLEVGDPAPPIQTSSWVNGPALAIEPKRQRRIVILTFFATWSEPSRAALSALADLHSPNSKVGVEVVAITADDADAVRSFLDNRDKPLGFRIAIDREHATTTAYCEAAGIGFVPYVFLIGPDRRIAWHGHPLQPELRDVLRQLQDGSYDRERARKLVRGSRSAEQLQAMFRDAYANEAWHAALLALNALLETDAEQPRLLRFKLGILLGELDREEEAGALVEQVLARYAGEPKLLNSFAWDLLSDARAFSRTPGAALKLAAAAYAADRDDASIVDTYGRALYMIGRVDRASEVQRRAVELAKGDQKVAQARTLRFYERCLALQREFDERTPAPTDRAKTESPASGPGGSQTP